jgi:DNA mismatch repair protein MutL
MVPLDWRDPADKIRVSGFAGAPEQFHKQRSSQYFFINGRNVFSPVAARALSSAYSNPQPGMHPAAVLFLFLPSEAVDVNIHPAKKEVRLQDEGLVFTAVRNAVRHALQERYQAPGLQIGASALSPNPHTRDSHPFLYSSAKEEGIAIDKRLDQPSLFLNETPGEKTSRIYQWPESSREEETVPEDIPRADTHSTQPVPYMQLHNGYILFEVQSGLMVVEQQAAHERILYEQALDTFRRSGKLSSQQLLFPEILEIDVESALLIENHVESFRSLGFELESFGGNTFQVRGIPSEVSQNEAMTVILAMLKNLGERTRSQNDIFTRMALAFARGACIKQGKSLSYPEMAQLIDKLFATQNPYMSPTGKTVILRYKIEEINKRFGKG